MLPSSSLNPRTKDQTMNKKKKTESLKKPVITLKKFNELDLKNVTGGSKPSCHVQE